MIPYVAFLHGINVGGHALVKMADLKKAFFAMGFQNVHTMLKALRRELTFSRPSVKMSQRPGKMAISIGFMKGGKHGY